jgi:bacteriorhodopsin
MADASKAPAPAPGLLGWTAAAFAIAALGFALFSAALEAVVCAVAAVAYGVMAAAPHGSRWGAGSNTTRSIDWAITTPLLLFALLRRTLSTGALAGVLTADVVMVALGWLGAVVAPQHALAFLVAGLVAFAAPAVALLANVARGALPWASGVTLVLWCAYPALYVQRFVRGAISTRDYVRATAAADLAAKIGVGALIVAAV